MRLCSMPLCQTTAGCKCEYSTMERIERTMLQTITTNGLPSVLPIEVVTVRTLIVHPEARA